MKKLGYSFSAYSNWLICRCSLVFGASIMQDNDENEYNPSHSSTSKSITCSYELCELGQTCNSPKQPCPYTVNYASTDTSSSGSLVEDILHLASDGVNASNTYVRAPIIIGYVLYLIFHHFCSPQMWFILHGYWCEGGKFDRL